MIELSKSKRQCFLCHHLNSRTPIHEGLLVVPPLWPPHPTALCGFHPRGVPMSHRGRQPLGGPISARCVTVAVPPKECQTVVVTSFEACVRHLAITPCTCELSRTSTNPSHLLPFLHRNISPFLMPFGVPPFNWDVEETRVSSVLAPDATSFAKPILFVPLDHYRRHCHHACPPFPSDKAVASYCPRGTLPNCLKS